MDRVKRLIGRVPPLLTWFQVMGGGYLRKRGGVKKTLLSKTTENLEKKSFKGQKSWVKPG